MRAPLDGSLRSVYGTYLVGGARKTSSSSRQRRSRIRPTTASGRIVRPLSPAATACATAYIMYIESLLLLLYYYRARAYVYNMYWKCE